MAFRLHMALLAVICDSFSMGSLLYKCVSFLYRFIMQFFEHTVFTDVKREVDPFGESMNRE